MVVRDNGNVGIGTVPSFLLDLKNSGATTPGIAIGNGTGNYLLGTGVTAANANDFGIADINTGITRFMINNTGKVGIGTISPDEMLAVNGTIHTQEVKVDLSGWEDRVFRPTYKLPSLSTVKNYIDLNHHLPDMPSEEEIVSNGLKLGDMERELTKKVEELTLYLLDKDNQLTAQKAINQNQLATNQALQAQLDLLKKQIVLFAAKKRTAKK